MLLWAVSFKGCIHHIVLMTRIIIYSLIDITLDFSDLSSFVDGMGRLYISGDGFWDFRDGGNGAVDGIQGMVKWWGTEGGKNRLV